MPDNKKTKQVALTAAHQQGVWMRLLQRPEEELGKVKLWDKLSDEQLSNHVAGSPLCRDIKGYSSFCMIADKISIANFCDTFEVGLLVKQSGRNIPHWQHPNLQAVTKNLDFSRATLGFTNDDHTTHVEEPEAWQYPNTSEKNVMEQIKHWGRVYTSQPWNEV